MEKLIEDYCRNPNPYIFSLFPKNVKNMYYNISIKNRNNVITGTQEHVKLEAIIRHYNKDMVGEYKTYFEKSVQFTAIKEGVNKLVNLYNKKTGDNTSRLEIYTGNNHISPTYVLRYNRDNMYVTTDDRKDTRYNIADAIGVISRYFMHNGLEIINRVDIFLEDNIPVTLYDKDMIQNYSIKIPELTRKLQSIDLELQTALRDKSELQKDLDALRSDNNKLSDDSKTFKNTQDQIQDLQKKLDQEKINKSNLEIDMNNKLQEKESELKLFTQRYNTLEQELKRSRDRELKLDESINDLNKKIAQLENEKEEIMIREGKCKSEIESLYKKLRSKEDERKVLENRMLELENETKQQIDTLVKQYEEELQKCNRDVEDLVAKKSEIETQLSLKDTEMRRTTRDLKDELDKVKRDLESSVKQQQELTIKLLECDIVKDNLRNTILERDASLEKVKSLEQRLQEIEEEKQLLFSRYQELESKNITSTSVNQTNTEYENTIRELNAKLSKETDKDQQIEFLIQKLNDLDEEKNKKYSEIYDQAQDKDKKIASLNEDIRRMEEEKKNLDAEYKNTITQLNAQLASKEQDKDKKINSLTDSLKRMEEEKKNIDVEYKNAIIQLSDQLSSKEGDSAKIESLKEDIKKIEKEKKDLEEECNSAIKRLKDELASKEGDSLLPKLKEIEEQKENLNAQFRDIMNQLNAELLPKEQEQDNDKIESLKYSLRWIEEQKQDLEDEYKKITVDKDKKIESLNEDITRMEKEKEELDAEYKNTITQLNAEFSSKDKKIASLNEDITRMEKEKKNLDAEYKNTITQLNAQLASKEQDKDKKIASLTDSLDKMKKEKESRDKFVVEARKEVIEEKKRLLETIKFLEEEHDRFLNDINILRSELADQSFDKIKIKDENRRLLINLENKNAAEIENKKKDLKSLEYQQNEINLRIENKAKELQETKDPNKIKNELEMLNTKKYSIVNDLIKIKNEIDILEYKNSLVEDIERWKIRTSELEHAKQQWEIERASLIGRIAKNEEYIKTIQEKIKYTENSEYKIQDYDKKLEEIAQLEEKIKENTREIRYLRQEEKKVKEILTELKDKENINAISDGSVEQTRLLIKAIKKINAEKKVLEEKNKELNENVKNLIGELDSTLDQKDRTESENLKLSKTILDLIEKIKFDEKTFENEKVVLEDRNKKMIEKSEVLLGELGYLGEALKKLIKEKKDNEDKLKSEDVKDKEKHKSEIDRLNKEILMLRETKINLETRGGNILQKRIDEMKRARDDLEVERASLYSQKFKLEEESRNNRSIIENLNKEKEELIKAKEEMEPLKEKIASMQRDLNKYNSFCRSCVNKLLSGQYVDDNCFFMLNDMKCYTSLPGYDDSEIKSTLAEVSNTRRSEYETCENNKKIIQDLQRQLNELDSKLKSSNNSCSNSLKSSLENQEKKLREEHKQIVDDLNKKNTESLGMEENKVRDLQKQLDSLNKQLDTQLDTQKKLLEKKYNDRLNNIRQKYETDINEAKNSCKTSSNLEKQLRESIEKAFEKKYTDKQMSLSEENSRLLEENRKLKSTVQARPKRSNEVYESKICLEPPVYDKLERSREELERIKEADVLNEPEIEKCGDHKYCQKMVRSRNYLKVYHDGLIKENQELYKKQLEMEDILKQMQSKQNNF